MKTRPHCAVCALVLNLLSQVGNLALRFCLTLESYYSPARNVIPDTHSVGSELVGASQTQQMTQTHPSTKFLECQMNSRGQLCDPPLLFACCFCHSDHPR
jgi:hypothetical protein